MKTRVLELLIEPKNIQNDDLQILRDQIQEFPYLQNVRALHLYGVHLYEPENYQKELSKTAAYTTDKKNLYHLINGNLETKKADIPLSKVSQIIENKKAYPAYAPKNGGFPLKRPEEKQEVNTEESPYTAVQPQPEVSNQPVEVEGQRNRILFEGEENFLNEENTVKIDLESSRESGNLVTEKLDASQDSYQPGEEILEEKPNTEAAAKTDDHLSSEIKENEPGSESKENVADVDESGIEKLEIPNAESVKGEAEETKINFNQSEIKVSPEDNFEKAGEIIAEEKAVSFQEIIPLETENKEEKTISQDQLNTKTEFSSETNGSDDKIETDANKSEVENHEMGDVEEKTDEVEETEINFNQSEIRVSPDSNLEEAVEAVAEDKAISFQEIAPLQTEIKENVEEAEKVSQDEVQNQTDFSSETIISEDKIESDDEKQKVEDDSQLSFHGTESFLPEVKMEAKTPVQQEIPAQNAPSKNKYEEEMRRLIEQVELKMKEAKKDVTKDEKSTEKEQETVNSEISFAETQSFDVETQSPEVVENEEEKKLDEDEISMDDEGISAQTETDSQSSETENESETVPSTSWKPMSFEVNTLDYSIGRKTEAAEQKPAEKPEPSVEEKAPEAVHAEEKQKVNTENTEQAETEEVSENAEENVEEDEKSAPAFNVSFFGSDISSFIKSNQKSEEEVQPEITPEHSPQPKAKPDQREIPSILDSNVPGFINTWQSWLKIDRTAEVEKEKIEIKEKAIEAFIENNPKISQLKDESSFVIKERNDDISHLMTETLAKLYTEQKLYSKAIQAYQILIGKHPDKKSYFEEKIQEVKDTRGR